MFTSKIITEIIENLSEFSVWANSYNKLFKVDLHKPWNLLWYCYPKAPRPRCHPSERSGKCNAPTLRRPWRVDSATLSGDSKFAKPWSCQPLLRIERSQ